MRIFFLLLLMPLALTVPSLTHADAPTQLQLNDAAVLQDFCTLFEAERAYYNAQYPYEYWPAHAYAVDITELINGNYLPPSWVTADPLTRNGYVFDFEFAYPYQITATPITLGVTGSWDLYGDWIQTIHMGTDATGALFDYSPCDIAQDISTNEAKVIEDLYAIFVALQTDSLNYGYEVDFLDYSTPTPPIIFGQWWDGDRRRNGYVYGYRGENSSGSPCPGCRYSAVAVPEHFGITGNRAFYLDQSGVIRAEIYRNAGPASPPVPDTASYPPNLLSDYLRNEIEVINNYACQIYQAEVDYQTANAVYTPFWDDLTSGSSPYLEGNWPWVEGYIYTLNDPSGAGDAYEVSVIPNVPGESGVRSYYFDASGMLRAGDPYSGADWNSPIIGNVCDEIIKLNPTPPAETPPALYHSGDYNVQDYKITLSELLRIIQFFNVGFFSCAPGSEDGYAAVAGDTSCSPHSGDYVTLDWNISMSELLRFIQLYNSYGYFPCPNPGEDGYCPIL